MPYLMPQGVAYSGFIRKPVYRYRYDSTQFWFENYQFWFWNLPKISGGVHQIDSIWTGALQRSGKNSRIEKLNNLRNWSWVLWCFVWIVWLFAFCWIALQYFLSKRVKNHLLNVQQEGFDKKNHFWHTKVVEWEFAWKLQLFLLRSVKFLTLAWKARSSWKKFFRKSLSKINWMDEFNAVVKRNMRFIILICLYQ